MGIGLVLLYRHEFKKVFVGTAIAPVLGALYLAPFAIYFHDPLHQLHQYKTEDWQSQSAIGWPFRALVLSLVHNRQPWTNVVFTTGWIRFALAGSLAMS